MKQIKCCENRKATAERKITEHIIDQRRQYDLRYTAQCPPPATHVILTRKAGDTVQ